MRNDRTQTFLMQFKSLVVSPDPRSFGRDASNPYYGLLYTVSKELQPKFVVELGTCTGGSTSHLAAGTSGNVLSIDIEIRPDARERLLAFDNIELRHGDTRDPELVAEVAKRGPIDLLFIDTDHTAEQVTAELSLFGPLVCPGGLIFFDDIRMNPGMSAWWDRLEENCGENTMSSLPPPLSRGKALTATSSQGRKIYSNSLKCTGPDSGSLFFREPVYKMKTGGLGRGASCRPCTQSRLFIVHQSRRIFPCV